MHPQPGGHGPRRTGDFHARHLAITGPIYITIALGYFTPQGPLRADRHAGSGQFVINLALPALLFNALALPPLLGALQRQRAQLVARVLDHIGQGMAQVGGLLPEHQPELSPQAGDVVDTG